MTIYAIAESEVVALAAQTATGMVKLVAVDYNWGPPIGGRFDADFLRIWAVARGVGEGGQVFVQGKQGADWRIDLQMQFKATVSAPGNTNYGLYYLELEAQAQFPTEFVIRLDLPNGQAFYDNNGGYGRNYELVPYRNRGASVISGPTGALFELPGITPLTLYFKTLSASESTDRHRSSTATAE